MGRRQERQGTAFQYVPLHRSHELGSASNSDFYHEGRSNMIWVFRVFEKLLTDTDNPTGMKQER